MKPMNRQAIYSKISTRADEIVERLFELSKSENPSVALGACKVLLERVTPPLKSLEVYDVAYLTYIQQYKTWKFMENEATDKILTRVSDQKVKNLLSEVE